MTQKSLPLLWVEVAFDAVRNMICRLSLAEELDWLRSNSWWLWLVRAGGVVCGVLVFKCHVALVCVLVFKLPGLSGAASSLPAVLPRREFCAKHR
jgi:hypothetical protein